MQAIVCDVCRFKCNKKLLICFFPKDVIGWRNDSRKLIVFSTDAGFHYAGDGRVCNKYTISSFSLAYYICFFYLDLVGWHYRTK